MAKVGLITVHGMGDTDEDYYVKIRDRIADRLGPKKWPHVGFEYVNYQKILQKNEERYFNEVKRKLRWDGMRRFMLYGFCDAASLESYKSGQDSPYYKAQAAILKTLKQTYSILGPGAPLIIIAQSLGGQVISNFLWDAHHTRKPKVGVWSENQAFDSADQEDFCRGKTLVRLYTTGCNIPIFVAGHDENKIEPIKTYRQDFKWKNFYDKDDVLGWPLGDLCDDYAQLVQDKAINSGFLASFTPFSHSHYWADGDVLRPLIADLKKYAR